MVHFVLLPADAPQTLNIGEHYDIGWVTSPFAVAILDRETRNYHTQKRFSSFCKIHFNFASFKAPLSQGIRCLYPEK